jgi:hypothetical protein
MMMSSRPVIRLTLTRDSVCAGDDVDAPHERVIEIAAVSDAAALLEQVPAGYLASVAGVGHSWTAILNGKPMARISINETEPLVSNIELAANNTLHFEYHSATY